ncbi:hypothetical protein GCM10010413_28580 [Promicromonospora sukumoe]|uniref:Uncharacterized protein n=1 Tax=Promicromonospora sukumoe TaxID=88382 RepID=A0A7W3J6H1_9MICO|nr:hypothetical protein [Promicromonospora sukumoe]MBA8807190.1 hypothetical protein [Promicromonospora sukumoe]
MRALTRTKNDPLLRARRAMHQVDDELDLARVHAATSGYGAPGTDPLPLDDDAAARVEILRPGQRPTQPRRRATAWALAATVALLCGAGVGAAALWSDDGGTLPGAPPPASPAPASPAPEHPEHPGQTPAQSSEPEQTTGPRECAPARPTPQPSATPSDEIGSARSRSADSGAPVTAPPSDACDVPAGER